jgi:Protein of unknown function, DUF481
MKIKLIFLTSVVLLFAYRVFAQVNTEKYRMLLDTAEALGVFHLDGSFQTGNTDLQEINSDFQYDLKGENHLLMFVINGNYGWKDSSRFSDGALSQVRYVRNLEEKLKLESYVQVNYDNTRLLKFRYLIGAGPRIGLLKTKSCQLWFGTSYMHEYERLGKPKIVIHKTVTRVSRWSNYLSFILAINDKLNLSYLTYFQPRFDMFKDFRILTEANLTSSVSRKFALTIGFHLLYDRYPPITVKNTDTNTTIGLDFMF